MPIEIPDIELKLEWTRMKDHLRVLHKGVLLYSSASGFASPVLSTRQVKWITEHYDLKRMKYVFA